MISLLFLFQEYICFSQTMYDKLGNNETGRGMFLWTKVNISTNEDSKSSWVYEEDTMV